MKRKWLGVAVMVVAGIVLTEVTGLSWVVLAVAAACFAAISAMIPATEAKGRETR